MCDGLAATSVLCHGLVAIAHCMTAVVVVLLNLLIAVMSEAYEEVKEVAEARWAYVQMEMLLEYDAEQADNAKSSGGSTFPNTV